MPARTNSRLRRLKRVGASDAGEGRNEDDADGEGDALPTLGPRLETSEMARMMP